MYHNYNTRNVSVLTILAALLTLSIIIFLSTQFLKFLLLLYMHNYTCMYMTVCGSIIIICHTCILMSLLCVGPKVFLTCPVNTNDPDAVYK